MAPARQWSPLVLAASVPGPGHLRDGLPCQDAHGWEWLPDGTLALTLADGAGSALQAYVGAQAAVQGAMAGARDAPQPAVGDGGVMAVLADRLWAALRGARRAVMDAAGALGEPLRELASTCMVCLWTEVGVAVGHIGDGAAVAWLGEGQGWQVLSEPSPGEYANETVFLTAEGWEASVRVTTLPAWVPGLVLTTDGCQRAALRRRPRAAAEGEPATWEWEPFAPFLQPILDFAREVAGAEPGRRELEALLRSEKLANHSDDDKTLAVLRADRWTGGRP